MAIVGDAHIIVRAITTNVEKDIRNGFKGVDKVGAAAGRSVGRSFDQNMRKAMSGTGVNKLRADLLKLSPAADKTSKAFHSLVRVGFFLQSGMGALGGSIGALVGGIGALIGVAGGATPAIGALGGAFASLIVGMQVAKGAFKGIGSALGKLKNQGGGGSAQDNAKQIEDAMKNLARVIEDNQKKITGANNKIRQSQLNLNAAFKAGREEIQQLGFDAEEAALGEKKAALELEKARETLARVQDLPPNSRARREAELAYQEAELNFRQAKDQNSDLATEQERLSKTGVEGTQTVIDARRELADAEQELRDVVVQSLRDQEDAQIRLNEAMKPDAGGGGGEDPLAGLTESQKKFTMYLYNTVLPLLFKLKEAAADSFLPVLEEQMNRMINGGLFDRLFNGITEVSKGLAGATKNFTDVLMSEDTLDSLSSFLSTTGKLLPQFGTIFGNVFGSVLAILDALEPVTTRFVTFLEQKSTAFKNFLDVKNSSGELTAFFQNAADLAARFGDVFGNIFKGIGGIIEANVGPGSGGDMLLTWLQTVTDGFANMDTGYLDSFYKNSVTNLLAMFDVLGGMISAIVNAGANPAVAQFWEILGSGAATFRSVVNESVKAAPTLATVLVRLGEIIAIFADSGSIQAFMTTIGYAIGALLGLLNTMQPMLNVIGPFFAIISGGALVVSMMSKGFAVLVGTLRSALLPLELLKTLTAKSMLMQQGLTVSTRQLAIAEAQLQLVQKQAVLTAAAKTVADLKNIGTTQAQVVADAELVIAKNAVAVATTNMGVASGIAGATMQAAFWPITLILLAIAAVAAVVFAGIAINQANLEKATAATTGALEDGSKAVDVYAASLLAIPDGYTKNFLADASNGFANMHATMQQLEGAQDGFWGWLGNSNSLTDGLAASLEATGKSLANIASKNLPSAQKSFANYTDGMKLSTKEQIVALNEMEDYTKALQDQASQMGINLLNADGTINKEKQLKFARGEGEVAIRGQIASLLEHATATREAAMANVSASDAFKAATTDAEGATQALNLDTFITNMNTQIAAATAQIENTKAAQVKGLSEAGVELLNSMGADGAAMAASLATADADTIARFNETAGALKAKSMSEMILGSQEFASALSGLADQMGPAGDAAAAKITEGIKNGTITAEQAVTGLGIRIPGMIPGVDFKIDTDAANKAVEGVLGKEGKSGIEAVRGALKNKPTMDVDTQKANNAVDTLQQNIADTNGKTVTMTVNTVVKKNGGFISAPYYQKDGGLIPAFADGGVARFATGMVAGKGGPRDDRVPAMLSAGEYVVNALATKRYLPLLQQLNNGSPTLGQSAPAAGSSNNISIVVNPSPGMDERALATMVSKELAFQMRKGGTI